MSQPQTIVGQGMAILIKDDLMKGINNYYSSHGVKCEHVQRDYNAVLRFDIEFKMPMQRNQVFFEYYIFLSFLSDSLQ